MLDFENFSQTLADELNELSSRLFENNRFVVLQNKIPKGKGYELIVYKNNGNDFLIEQRNMVAIIYLWNEFDLKDLASICIKLSKKKSNNKKLFIGIHSSKFVGDFERILKALKPEFEEKLQKNFIRNRAMLDCISFDKDYFMRFWNKHPEMRECSCLSFYKIENKSYEYLLSNCKESIKGIIEGRYFTEEEEREFYHLLEGKESHNLSDLTLKLENIPYY